MALIDLDRPSVASAGSPAVAVLRKLAVLVAVGLVLAVPGEPYRATPVPAAPPGLCQVVGAGMPAEQVVAIEPETGAFTIICQG
jgi:hypothetical protein